MSKSIKHSASYEGFTFTRTSKSRNYSHAVLSRGSVAQDRVSLEESARSYFKQNRRYYESLADGSYRGYVDHPGLYSPAEIARRQEEAVAWLAGGVEGRVAADLASYNARLAARQLCADGDTYYVCDCWCSRLDLAQKAAGMTGIVVPAVVL